MISGRKIHFNKDFSLNAKMSGRSVTQKSGYSPWDTFRKAFKPAVWEDREEFLDLIYWGRQIISIVIGFLWGYLGKERV